MSFCGCDRAGSLQFVPSAARSHPINSLCPYAFATPFFLPWEESRRFRAIRLVLGTTSDKIGSVGPKRYLNIGAKHPEIYPFERAEQVVGVSTHLVISRSICNVAGSTAVPPPRNVCLMDIPLSLRTAQPGEPEPRDPERESARQNAVATTRSGSESAAPATRC